jgi:signal transduction histidine kinase
MPMERFILIIDDSADDREAMIRALKKLSNPVYRYAVAEDGKKGLALLGERRPDCVLLDYSLPGHNGLDVLKSIRERDAFVPVIMLTGQGNESIAVQAIQEGAQNYLSKAALAADTLDRAIVSAIDHARMEKALSDQRHRIEDQSTELQAINEELETFTYIASHDLRSPLVSLKGFSAELDRSLGIVRALCEKIMPHLDAQEQAALEREVRERIPKSLHYITSAAEKMDRLTSAILKLSRLGRREIAPALVDSGEVVRECIAALEHQIEQSQTAIDLGEMPQIIADRTAIEQIFGNLLDNAVKYLEPDRPGRIRISGRMDHNQAAFSVQDNGRGIAAEDMHKVFEIFRRAGDVENIPGDGMGMPYVRAIIKRHGGNIWCESTPGQGTTFHFTIANKAA